MTGPAFTQEALLALLPACPALHTLRLRHVAPLTAGFCRSVAGAAPLLRHLLVDGCDLGGVSWVRLAPDPHGSLVEVQVGDPSEYEHRCIDIHMTTRGGSGKWVEVWHGWKVVVIVNGETSKLPSTSGSSQGRLWQHMVADGQGHG
jgi:hypothetical protein